MTTDAILSPKPSLIYTIAFDSPKSEGQRFLAKMLVSSLLRTYFNGTVVVFRNSEVPLFLVERKGLEEVWIDVPQDAGQAGAEAAWSWKYRVAEMIDTTGYDKVMFLDADTLALRNVDHLLEGDWDIRFQPERGLMANGNDYNASFTERELALVATRSAVNSGSIAVRAEIFHEVMREWRRIDEGKRYRQTGFWDQASWNALLLRHTSTTRRSKTKWLAQPFPEREIQFPMYLDPNYRSYSKAAVTHNCGMNTLGKIEFTFGLYMRTFFCDPTGLFFSMLET
jgi:hypothetical protein